jgi:hypothetical protein
LCIFILDRAHPSSKFSDRIVSKNFPEQNPASHLLSPPSHLDGIAIAARPVTHRAATTRCAQEPPAVNALSRPRQSLGDHLPKF